MANRWGKNGNSDRLYFGRLQITADGDCSHEIKTHLLLGKKTMTNLDSILKSRDNTLPTNVSLVKAMVFSSSHVWMWELDYKEGWALKNQCCQVVVLEKTLEMPLDYKEIKLVSLKGNQRWIFIGKFDAEAEAPILWLPDAKNWLSGKDLDAGKDWSRRRRGWQRMASPTWWTWVWAGSGRWWWTGKPGVLQSTGSQRVRHDWVTELNWTESVSSL